MEEAALIEKITKQPKQKKYNIKKQKQDKCNRGKKIRQMKPSK